VLAAVPAARTALRASRVDLVVSARSGVAVPWFLAARITGVRAVWVETFNIVDRTGLPAGLCARLASHVVVQRPHLLGRHRRAVAVGALWWVRSPSGWGWGPARATGGSGRSRRSVPSTTSSSRPARRRWYRRARTSASWG